MEEAETTIYLPYACSVIDPNTGVAMEYWDLLQHPGAKTRTMWQRYSVVEFSRIRDGVYETNTEDNKTIHFVPFKNIPESKNLTYASFIINFQPHK